MKIEDPDIYYGKTLKILSPDGTVTVGELDGYSYDYDDDGNEVLELDVENEDGLLIGLTEDEIEKIEVVSDG